MVGREIKRCGSNGRLKNATVPIIIEIGTTIIKGGDLIPMLVSTEWAAICGPFLYLNIELRATFLYN
tara:strand:- start:581 stop:781 length:201 start_codon:yes stop_codon:yes gene_type:complete